MDSCIKQNWKFIQRTQKRGIPNDVASTLKKKKNRKNEALLIQVSSLFREMKQSKKIQK